MTATTRRAPIVLLDMDGVLADFAGGFWEQWAVRWPQAPGRELAEVAEFYVDDQVPAGWRAAARALVCDPGFFRRLPAVEGATVAARAMLQQGWDVRICTAPILQNPTCVEDKLAWVEEHLGSGWAERVVVTKDKTLVHGQVLVDDRAAVDGAIAPTWNHVVFDAPHNLVAPRAVARLRRWEEWMRVLAPLLEPGQRATA